MASPANHLGVRMTSACSVLGSTWVGAVLAAVVVGATSSGLLTSALVAHVYACAICSQWLCCTCWLRKCEQVPFALCGGTQAKCGPLTIGRHCCVPAHSAKAAMCCPGRWTCSSAAGVTVILVVPVPQRLSFYLSKASPAVCTTTATSCVISFVFAGNVEPGVGSHVLPSGHCCSGCAGPCCPGCPGNRQVSCNILQDVLCRGGGGRRVDVWRPCCNWCAESITAVLAVLPTVRRAAGTAASLPRVRFSASLFCKG